MTKSDKAFVWAGLGVFFVHVIFLLIYTQAHASGVFLNDLINIAGESVIFMAPGLFAITALIRGGVNSLLRVVGWATIIFEIPFLLVVILAGDSEWEILFLPMAVAMWPLLIVSVSTLCITLLRYLKKEPRNSVN